MTSFTHIHCSSRFDRPAASLEADLDDWMAESDLVTLTEITNDHRAATLREKGWNYFNAKKDNGSDQCGICWDASVWTKKRTNVRELQNNRYYTLSGHVSPHVWAITLLLKNKEAGSTLMVSVSHMPAHVQGNGKFGARHDQTDAEWRARKLAYTTAMRTWSDTVKTLQQAWKPDATMAVADFNLDIKENWVRDYLKNHWQGTGLQLAWRNFSTLGTSIDGGSRVIDATLYGGMQIQTPPKIMAGVRSSDHRPYKESFSLGRWDQEDWDASGSTEGDPWWGFGDYRTDEMFVQEAAVGESHGEVL